MTELTLCGNVLVPEDKVVSWPRVFIPMEPEVLRVKDTVFMLDYMKILLYHKTIANNKLAVTSNWARNNGN